MRKAFYVAGLVFAAFGLGSAHAQQFPDRAITIYTTAAGGGADFGARLIAQGLSEELKQPVVVENRKDGRVSNQIVKEAPPDGYTLLYLGAAHWLAPLMMAKPPYDPVKDYEPVSMATSTPSVLVVPASSPVNTVQELIKLAKSKPGELNYSSGGNGSSGHLAGALFANMTGTDLVHVGYGGGGPATLAVLSGEVQLSFATGGAILPQVKAGKVKALGVTTEKNSELMPDLPTVAETVPGYQATAYAGVFAPANTPKPIVTKLNEAISRVLARPDVKKKFAAAGTDIVGGTPEYFKEAIKAEMDRMGKVIKAANIRSD